MSQKTLQLAIFARAPVAGQCKTRLIPALGAKGAAELHAQLVESTVKTALDVENAKVTLWTANEAEHPFFTRLTDRFPALSWRVQPEGDLGARMHHVFESAKQPTLLMGSDCPALTADLLRSYAQCLEHHDAVIVPAEDGGYVLIGLNSPCRGLFNDMQWSTDQVMQQTRVRLQQYQLDWFEPETLWDVDRPEDLKRLTAISSALLGS